LGPGRAYAINPAGQVVGFSTTADEVDHAFLWSHGVMTDLGPGRAYAINPAGQVVGYINTPPVGIEHAFIWFRGKMTDLGAFGGFESIARGINPAGQVVGGIDVADDGSFGFLWSNGVKTDLRMLAAASGINPAGQVVGSRFGRPVLLTIK
jgi:probable HAF family extracellular repeat protein